MLNNFIRSVRSEQGAANIAMPNHQREISPFKLTQSSYDPLVKYKRNVCKIHIDISALEKLLTLLERL